ncbi:tRNA lysidine(34) synthetase TilS [Nocardioides sp. GY 10113]|uniref:tRNA lysidine(34) synthetase TilS n=1 Tax=Nocardioides sp. GY 10113 TaxID=2569761 RepID=UPI0010A819EB|nr:tRNA lysidine(34) synthetase TilS [Nocardioides sp. GY 10113]TIC89208.1 tRNA lysidine(34) synthetase TilS [Nocardioides sp. GY 10113]
MALHPSVAAVRRGVRRCLDGVEPGDSVVVACSGGPDSLALLAATIFEARKRHVRVVGATVDHGLQEGSAAHADAVVVQMATLGVDETAAARVQVDPAGVGPEAAARRARYAVLEQMREHFGARLVLLGHTRDDQAETVLLGLARGSGGRSLAGMRRGFDHYARPLLDVSRDDTVTACQVEGIEFWDDPHNSDPGYTRVRVRQRVLPVLEAELGPGVAATLARTADQVRDDVEALDAIAERVYAELRAAGEQPGDRVAVPLRPLWEQYRAVASRVLRLAALEAGAIDAELFHVHVSALLDLAAAEITGEVQLPGHVSAVRAEGAVRFRRTGSAGAVAE